VLDELRAVLAGEPAWIVGGAVRDRLLGRPTEDFDIALEGDPERAARALRGRTGGAAFPLSKTFGGWRVVAQGGSADFLPLTGGTLASDLAARDFTVNAMAEPAGGGALVDPHNGAADLEARALRAVGPQSFTSDPVRVLRAVRLAAELGFTIEAATLLSARAAAPGLRGVAAERVFAELKRIVCVPEPAAAMRLMEGAGATAAVLPELLALKGVEQSVYHHLDVYDHTLDVLDAVVRLERDEQDPRVQATLAEPLADELTRWHGLRFAALLHDIAKPETARRRADGRGAAFVGHDALGAEMARVILRRLRASERLADHVAALTLHHLRVGFLVHERPLEARAVHRYLQTTAPWTVDVTVFTCADRLATRGRKSDTAIAAHLALARELLEHAFAGPPAEPLVRGDELARELGVRPGPQLGELLARLEEDRFAGEISTREQAIARARDYLDQ
jgi:poly(A) polymerase